MNVAEMQTRFVAYYRVSTDKQGRSGLGLEAQKAAVKAFLDGKGWPPIAEFVEIESGRKSDRPELAKALDRCRLCKATLVIAKLDRLARNAAFLLSLRDAGIEFVACDMPDANRLTVGIMAMVAEAEVERISTTTRQALAAAKARGTKLGGFKGYKPTDADRAKATAALSGKAASHAARVAPVVAEIKAAGHRSLRAIATELNARGIPSPRGGEWSSVAVMRLLDRKGQSATS